jgi:hypothetical protein
MIIPVKIATYKILRPIKTKASEKLLLSSWIAGNISFAEI